MKEAEKALREAELNLLALRKLRASGLFAGGTTESNKHLTQIIIPTFFLEESENVVFFVYDTFCRYIHEQNAHLIPKIEQIVERQRSLLGFLERCVAPELMWDLLCTADNVDSWAVPQVRRIYFFHGYA